MENEKMMEKQQHEIEDDLSMEEAIFLIEWGYDIRAIKENSKKKAQA
jgi:hypothetical protein